MCREHGEPWHEGLTCEQHDSIKAHGDPDFQRTTDWIAQNTKPCPRCNRSIQKGEACFHMTCKFFLTMQLLKEACVSSHSLC